MVLTLQELIKDVWSRTWRDPILRTLGQHPMSYSELRKRLLEMRIGIPADSQITYELSSMSEMGWVEKKPRAKGRPVWAPTELGKDVVATLKMVGDLRSSPSPLVENNQDERLSETHLKEFQQRTSSINPAVAHPARRYNYLLGGKDNFAADRAAGRFIEERFPAVRVSIVEGRRFLHRVVSYLAGEAGIDQFLDIGTGLPSANNTHEVAQRINPSSRVVYVDNDPMVLTHSRALLTSTPEGRSHYLEEDLRNADKIIDHPEAREVLDFSRPVALMLIAVLHFIKDDEEAFSVTRRLIERLPAGSFVAITHLSVDTFPPEEAAAHYKLMRENKTDAFARTRQQITQFFNGLEIIAPGIVVPSDWRSPVAENQRPPHKDIAGFSGVARKR